jgi:cyclin T
LSHRFFAYQSFKQHDRFVMGVAALFLASKVEESYLKYKQLQTMVKAYLIVRRRMNTTPSETEIRDIENKILIAERLLLQTLCFDLKIDHPYRSCLQKIRALKSFIAEDSRDMFHQVAVNFVNDSFRTSLCLQFNPNQIALGAVFLATLYMNLAPVNTYIRNTAEKTWFELLEPDIDEEALKSICSQLMDVYLSGGVASGPVIVFNADKIQKLKTQLNFMGPAEIALRDSCVLPSPDSIANPPSGPHMGLLGADPNTDADRAGLKRARDDSNDDVHGEVDIQAAYPYADEPARPTKVTVTVVKASASSSSSSSQRRDGLPYATSSSSMSSSSAYSSRNDAGMSVAMSSSVSMTPPPPPPPPESPAHGGVHESPAILPGGIRLPTLPSSVPDTPDSLPPPPPPDTPDAGNAGDLGEVGGMVSGSSAARLDASPPPPPPDTPNSNPTPAIATYTTSTSPSPKRARV